MEQIELEQAQQIATLPFGLGKVGIDRHLQGADQQRYLRGLSSHQHEIPTGLWLPIDCMDDRPTIGLADGTTDPTVLLNRRAGQLPGGTVLATVKAAIAADAAYIKDAKTMQQAYEITYNLLSALGIPDAAHEGCGASNLVEKSVSEPIDGAALIKTFVTVGASADTIGKPLGLLTTNKNRRLNEGFYNDWDSAWHADFVTTRQPENFSYLATKNDAVSGHHASGLVLVKDGHYFAKNAFTAETSAMAFALTFGEADRIAQAIGGSDEEKALFSLAFRDDAFNVANHIVALGLEVAA